MSWSDHVQRYLEKSERNLPKKPRKRKPRTKKRNRRKPNAERNELVAKMAIKRSLRCLDCKKPTCELRLQRKNSGLHVVMSAWDFPAAMLQLTVLRHFQLPYDIVYYIMQMVATPNRVQLNSVATFHRRCFKRCNSSLCTFCHRIH